MRKAASILATVALALSLTSIAEKLANQSQPNEKDGQKENLIEIKDKPTSEKPPTCIDGN